MNDVELEFMADSLSHRICIEMEIIFWEAIFQSIDVNVLYFGYDIDIVRQARLTVNDTGHRPGDKIGNLKFFKALNNAPKKLSLIHGAFFGRLRF